MIREALKATLAAALNAVACDEDSGVLSGVDIELTDPPSPEMGDFSTNLALVYAQRAGMSPRDLAQEIADAIEPADLSIDRLEVAGPGFINIFLHDDWLHETVAEILQTRQEYGRRDIGEGRRMQVEFVSANPVGPIHIGNARGAPYGDVVASMLEALGYEVEREYYVNDGPNNTQALKFGRSVRARYLRALGHDAQLPEDGYRGDYVTEMGQQLAEDAGDKYADLPDDDETAHIFFELMEENIVKQAREDLADFGIEYDVWFTEQSLYDTGAVAQEIENLREMHMAYDKDGAVWLKTEEFGDDQDRVLVRSNGNPTYIASDAAYAANKFSRGFDHLIYVFGPDHAGYVPRLRAVLAACGFELDRVEMIVHQTVRLQRGGEPVKLAKREGKIYSVRDLIEEVGTDAARFFFLMRSIDSHLDFDLELAKRQTEENPVYYVQYAHARICSIERQAEETGFEFTDSPELSVLTEDAEKTLMRKLADYPYELQEAADERAPHRLTNYLRELTQTFHQFYTHCQVLDTDDTATSTARMALCEATKQVLRNCLGILGISAPESM